MDFDFHALYAAYPTKALLQIAASPHQYQAGAIKAAEDILATRNPAEVQSAESELYRPESIPAAPPGGLLRESIFDEEEPAERPELLRRYQLIITIAVSFMIGFVVYQQCIRLWYLHDLSFIFFRDIHTAISTGIELISIIAVVLFIQKKHAGWILIAGVVTFYALSFMLAVLVYVYYRNFDRLLYTSFLLLLYSGVAYLLWLPGIRKSCHVEEQTAIRTVIISATATVGYCIWIAISMASGR